MIKRSEEFKQEAVRIALTSGLPRERDLMPTITVRGDTAGSIEEASKANDALAPIFPIMIVPTLLLTGQPFGFSAILGLIALAGILMRNTLILIGQIHDHERGGMYPYDAVVEATVQRSRPVILTALAAVLAFVPLTSSVFWDRWR